MNEEPKKWKRGDIGPDGRVFWRYHPQKKSDNGEYWVSFEDLDRIKVKHRGGKSVKARDRASETNTINLSNSSKFDVAIKMLCAITPRPGQFMWGALMEASGWPENICRFIFPEPEKLDNPASADTLPVGPDLF